MLLLLSAPGLAQAVLTVDGVALGMTYDQVLGVHGKPRVVGHRQGISYFLYPTPVGRPEGPSVWFCSGRVVFATGYTLEKDGEPLFLYGLEGSLLREEFGPPRPLNAFARWWPDSGVVLAGSNNLWPEEMLRAPLGLRDPDFPIRWERDGDRLYSAFEPWVDDGRESWLAGDVELGMPEERARRLAGSLQVLCQGGFVRAVVNPDSVLLSRRVDGQDRSLNFELAEPPMALGETPSYPQDGWYSPAPGGHILLQDGRVAQMRLELPDPAMFEALERLVRQSGGTPRPD